MPLVFDNDSNKILVAGEEYAGSKIKQGTGIIFAPSGAASLVNNDGVLTFNGAKGATTYYGYKTVSDGSAATSAVGGNETLTVTSGSGIKVAVTPNGHAMSISSTQTVLVLANNINLAPDTSSVVFAVPSLAPNGYVEVSGCILCKFGSGTDNSLTFTINPTTNIGNTDIGFTLHKTVITSEQLEITVTTPIANATGDMNANLHVARFSGVVANSSGAPVNFELIVKNSNSVGQGVSLAVLAKSFIKFTAI